MPRYRQSEREQLRSKTRQKLLDAAIDEFTRSGYAAANINTISIAAGFAKGTIYNYFSSKQALMIALITETASAHVRFIIERVRLETDPVHRLESFYAAGFDYIQQYPREAHFLINTLYISELAFKAAMNQAYRPMFELVGAEILAPGIAQGIFIHSTDLGITTALLMTIYLGAGSQVNQEGKTYLDPQAVSTFVLNALRPLS
jgi:AcrR family transcriptional regulator